MFFSIRKLPFSSSLPSPPHLPHRCWQPGCSVQHWLQLLLHWKWSPLLCCKKNLGTAFSTITLKPYCLTCLPFACAIYGIKQSLNMQRNSLFVPPKNAWKMHISVFSSMCIQGKRNICIWKEEIYPGVAQEMLLPLSEDGPAGECISLNFNTYFLLCSLISPLLVQSKKTRVTPMICHLWPLLLYVVQQQYQHVLNREAWWNKGPSAIMLCWKQNEIMSDSCGL